MSRTSLVLATAATCLALAACEDKGGRSSPPAPSAVTAPPPATSTRVVNAKLGCRPTIDDGSPLKGAPDGRFSLTASRGKALVVAGDARFVLDGDGNAEGPEDAGAGAANAAASAAAEGRTEKPTASVSSAAPFDVTLRAAGKTATVRLDAPATGEKLDAPVAAAGNTWAAVAWRATKGNASELRVVRLSPDGKKEASTVLAKGNLGPAALAFEGDVLHAVWPERAGDDAPYRLRWVKWAGKGAPGETQTLSTRGGSATQPSVAAEAGGAFAVAWLDGDPGKAVVKAGWSHASLLHAVTNADDVSDRSGKAHDPAVTLDGPKAWVVWRDNKGLRATSLRCIE